MIINKLVGGGGSLKVGEITLQDKSGDSKFLLCNGSVVYTPTELLKLFNVGKSDAGTTVFGLGTAYNTSFSRLLNDNLFLYLYYSSGFYLVRMQNGDTSSLTQCTGFSVTSTSNRPTDIAYGNGLYVMVGYGGKIYTSSDGTTFTLRYTNSSLCGSGYVVSIVYKDDMFIVSASTSGALATSINGIDWTQTLTDISATSQNLYLKVVNHKLFGFGSSGYVGFTENISNWTYCATVGSVGINDIAYYKGLYIITCTNGTIMTSQNLSEWTVRYTITTNNYVNSIYFDEIKNRICVLSYDGQMIMSENGTDWTIDTTLKVALYNGDKSYGHIGAGYICFTGRSSSGPYIVARKYPLQLPNYATPAYIKIS